MKLERGYHHNWRCSNNWTKQDDFGGNARSRAVGFSIGTKGYVGTGEDLNYLSKEDFWEYTPDGIATGNQSPTLKNLFEVYPNPVQNEFTIITATPAREVTIQVYDPRGKIINLPATIENSQTQINTSALPSGFYTLQITDNPTGMSEVRKFVKQE